MKYLNTYFKYHNQLSDFLIEIQTQKNNKKKQYLKMKKLLTLYLLIGIFKIYQTQQTDNYQRVEQSCLLLTPQKLKCFLPSNSKNCCQNCNDIQISCQGVTRYKQVFYLAKFIDCPQGVIVCQIVNLDEILKSEWLHNFFQNDQDIEKLSNLIQFQALECEEDYILLGGMCIERQNCIKIKFYNGFLSCYECQKGYYLNDQGKCVKCTSFMYLNSLKREIDQTNQLCNECDQDNNCFQCIDGYNLFYDKNFQQNVCVQCQNYCKCDSFQSCIECTYPYYYKRKYFSTKNEETPVYEACESCLSFVENHLGPNLKIIMQKQSLKIEDIIKSCEGLELEKIALKNLIFKDIVDQIFNLRIFLINGMFETCSEGCAKCLLNEQKQILQCLICQNGYYKDIKKDNICLNCQERDSESQLCHIIDMQYQMPQFQSTQCKTYFNQPYFGKSNQFYGCTIQPTCMIADGWNHENKVSKGSCKKCLQGYKKVRFDPNYNYFQCVKQIKNQKNSQLLDQCQQGYFLDDITNSCIPCSYNCLKCDIKGCTKCDKTRAYSNFLSNGYLECIVIQEKTSDVINCFLFSEGQLEQQMQRPQSGYCQQCKRGYSPVYQVMHNLKIIVECQPIIQNCLIFESNSLLDEENLQKRHELVCNLCEFGYFIENNICKPIPKNCALFDTFLRKCQNCKYGYKLEQNECIQCTNITSISQIGFFKCLSTIEEIELSNN
ncbi:hypothetical protein TTHERM_00295440 (macronuclear) [Tetrahymena thermophila SB210]|uniref:Uncharacterized protein n=1 Tax=Tetrahymena thermophila (strain SB210) TaxID=312017 RepID=I7M7G0_TETTS|nr:hypothetical protein TTHERM_00295440 [Tetrahymena thermophila SB210]EAR92931.2 hypothetical protein TTHERM_00295440 [Tetrahymena thermophila SB210]|eukprot:XP_001013176.2 hypothetical protein TTHERM_00295440 [Tetrahymena thermophila SB210]